MIKTNNYIQETEPKTKAKRGRKPKAEVEVESTVEEESKRVDGAKRVEDAKRVEEVDTQECYECKQEGVYIRRIKRLD